MKLLRRTLCGYYVSSLWRRKNFKSAESFNKYNYRHGFFWAGILSSFYVFLPLSILFSLLTDMPSNITFLISIIIAMLFCLLVTNRLERKFPTSWYEKYIVAPTNRMPHILQRKFLTYVNILYLLNIVFLIIGIVIFMIVDNRLH